MLEWIKQSPLTCFYCSLFSILIILDIILVMHCALLSSHSSFPLSLSFQEPGSPEPASAHHLARKEPSQCTSTSVIRPLCVTVKSAGPSPSCVLPVLKGEESTVNGHNHPSLGYPSSQIPLSSGIGPLGTSTCEEAVMADHEVVHIPLMHQGPSQS